MSDEYVKPPKKNNEDEYVAPPKKSGGVSTSSTNMSQSQNEYVAPPKRPNNKQTVNTTTSNASSISEGGYFDTPKMPWRFYLTGYLVLSLIGVFYMSNTNIVIKALYCAYFLLSNYTYSWFTDYQRFKGGLVGWFFTPYGSVKSGFAYSSMMDFSTGEIKRTWTGSYKMKTRTGITDHIIAFIIMTVIVELIKYVVALPVAFISLFLHKSTIRKYTEAAIAASQQQ